MRQSLVSGLQQESSNTGSDSDTGLGVRAGSSTLPAGEGVSDVTLSGGRVGLLDSGGGLLLGDGGLLGSVWTVSDGLVTLGGQRGDSGHWGVNIGGLSNGNVFSDDVGSEGDERKDLELHCITVSESGW